MVSIWKNKGVAIFIIAILVVAFGVFIAKTMGNIGPKNMNSNSSSSGTRIKFETTYWNFVLQLYDKEMPITTGNFKKLVGEGFYDDVIFHRVIKDFMIQGGDPTGTGMGGPGYKIRDEFTRTSIDENARGTISMANSGPNTGGSQFFINLVDNNYLDGKHPVFGKIVEGMDVIDKIGNTATGSGDKPIKEAKIIKATII